MLTWHDYSGDPVPNFKEVTNRLCIIIAKIKRQMVILDQYTYDQDSIIIIIIINIIIDLKNSPREAEVQQYEIYKAILL